MPMANMESLWARIRKFYKENKTKNKYSILKISMFTAIKSPKSKMPCLKGKAAEVRSLGPALLDACQHWMDDADPLFGQVIAGMQMSIRMEQILGEQADEWKLPSTKQNPDDALSPADEYLDCCYNYLAFFTSLARTFQSAPYNYKLFNVTIKCHYLLHSALMAKHLNPRLVWCYAAEDYMHKVKILGQSCVKGTPAWQVSNKVAEKWLAGFAGRLQTAAKL